MEELTYLVCHEMTTLKNNLNKIAEVGAKFPGMFNMTIYQNAGAVRNAQDAFAKEDNNLLLKYCEHEKKGQLKKIKTIGAQGQQQFIVQFKTDADELKYINEREELLKQNAGKFQIKKASQTLVENMEKMQNVTPLPGMEIFFMYMVESPEPDADVKVEEKEDK